VLVIDDERLLGQTLRLGLGDAFEVQVETSGQKGLDRLLAGEQYDAVLCDLSLPDRSGEAIYAAVRVARPELSPAFVIMTGGAVTEESRLFLQSFEGQVLSKPFTLGQVEQLVADLVARG
jgi:DNA-binding response OmpR family regulator